MVLLAQLQTWSIEQYDTKPLNLMLCIRICRPLRSHHKHVGEWHAVRQELVHTPSRVPGAG
jgi:hypothetical protein